MTRRRFLLHTIIHFRLANLAVILGMALATAILTGALMVGDSVKQSLYDLTLSRLGPIDYALTPGRFIPEDLATRVSSHPNFKTHFTSSYSSIILRGGATNDSTNTRTSGVQIAALGGDLLPVP